MTQFLQGNKMEGERGKLKQHASPIPNQEFSNQNDFDYNTGIALPKF